MSDRLKRKQFSRLTSRAVLLMLATLGAVFMGFHYASQW
jgi:hypothetical protein